MNDKEILSLIPEPQLFKENLKNQIVWIAQAPYPGTIKISEQEIKIFKAGSVERLTAIKLYRKFNLNVIKKQLEKIK